MRLRLLFSVTALLLQTSVVLAQKWVDDLQKPDANLYSIQAEFEQYWSNRNTDEKGKGYKAFRRWEHFVAPRVFPSGDISQLQQTVPNYETFLRNYQDENANTTGKLTGGGPAMIASTTWSANGPFGAINGSAGSQLLKSGRLNFITIDPTNTLSLWVGAPAGGLWHSTNGGSSWTTNTDQLGVIGCSDLAIDPTNTNVMYLATGDGNAGDTRTIGVLKSLNGGATWSATGFTNPVSTYLLIRRLIINPSNTQILMAATNSGIYRTTNGGTSWSIVSNQNTHDLEFKPGDPNVVYAAGNNFRISTNGGATWTQITAGLPTTGFQRLAIAVTPHDNNYVYLLGSRNSDSGFEGLYRSTVGGTVFTTMSTSANINVLGWSSAGTDVGGQGWYDLCIAASPFNKDEIVVGGVNVWRSLNGGTNWSLYGHWVGSGAPFTHADHHDLEYAPDGTLFNCNDGTVYRRTATAWQEISGLMNISQIYKIGLSTMTANKWITGHQDNGTSTWSGTTYQARIGGDGMDCFFDRTSDLNVFGSTQNGGFQRSTNGGTSWTGAQSGLSGTAPWVTIWKQDPQVSNRLYAGRQNLFVSNNLAVGWSSLTALPASGAIKEFAIAPSNNQIIYVLKSNAVFKTTNAGTTWSTVTNGLPLASAQAENICIDPTDPNNAWVVLSGYSAGNKVFMTTNGGSTWTNYSANLPNLPANCIVYQPGTNDLVYVGMDIGVYYRSNTSSTWTLYNLGLPNVPISDMEITGVNNGLLHAATYGRGVWSVSLFAPTGAPNSLFTFAKNLQCVGSTMTFTDQSQNSPTNWLWSVSPSSGVQINSPTAQNPSITFPSAGTYTVNLQASNGIGQGTLNSQVVTVTNPPVVNIAISSQNVCLGTPVHLTASGATTYTWSGGGGTANTATFFPTAVSVYSVAGTTNSCSVVKTITVNANPLPQVAINAPQSVCPGQPFTLTASGAVNYTWSSGTNGTTYTTTLNSSTSFSVNGLSQTGCRNTGFAFVNVYPLPFINVTASSTMICLGEEVQLTGSGANSYQWLPGGQAGNSFVTSPLSSIVYTCVGLDANNCENSTAITVSVSACQSIAESYLNGDYKIFPNPVKSKLTLRANNSRNADVLVTVFDITGKQVIAQSLHFNESGNAELNMEKLAAGTYTVKLHSGLPTAVSFKVVKE